MALPKVVIVGRPNVGKSSLFNWLAGRRIAIVDDIAGVTRDRVGTLVQLGEDDDPRFFELVDTGGVGIVDRDDLSQDVERQIDTAMNEADLILFVVDIREELMPLDEEVGQRLRYLKTPVILVMNKADDPIFDDRGGEFYKLGRGKPIAVSTHQNRNKKQLLRLIEKLLPWEETQRPADAAMKIAVVGRPNTGKSTFINTLAQAERMIVSERPGTTRDSVDVHFELDGLPFMAIDTAGVKRKAKIRDDLDFYSVHRAERSIRRADVVYLFLDPTQGISRLDKQLADYIAKEYKPCIFVINKWDLMLADEEAQAEGRAGMTRFAHVVQHAFRNMSYMPMAFITAKTGKNVKSLLNLSQSLFKQANRRISTGTLNRVLREAVAAHPPSMRENRAPRIYYATQVGEAPPTVVLFVNSPRLFDATYLRYLLNIFREKLPFRDVPIKLYMRARKQTEAGERRPRREAEAGVGEDWVDVDYHALPGEKAGNAVEHEEVRFINREVNELLSDLDD
ncbi:ribosome biogenesis GTPase Der [Planctomyces sp. SH-PL62]|uniref:ribosome biogenesis GTPase Der n=1 Tax=Planctomyces sp. SH-PL62 TaxID=1636152 RepID=UPI00078B730A|nr:ribosome biogenesis GTPase Der [Planctomyces sp. SH-PL62]AMV39744.1 GTPase Der [Planctomyces sp. SH-PL62]